jgi:hypothetical protein
VYFVRYRDKKVVGVFVPFSCATSDAESSPRPAGGNPAIIPGMGIAKDFKRIHMTFL